MQTRSLPAFLQAPYPLPVDAGALNHDEPGELMLEAQRHDLAPERLSDRPFQWISERTRPRRRAELVDSHGLRFAQAQDHIRDELRRGDLQGGRQAQQHEQRGLPEPTFEKGWIRAIEVAQIGKLILCNALRLATGSKGGTEG